MLTERYRVPRGTSQAELVIKGSRFIGTLASARDADAAEAFLNEMRQRYADATHNAWAYRIPSTPQPIIAFSDDGEPGGTAGRPMLSMLAGADLYEAVVVGTRYFGGVKLGTGGLVRAYGGAARAAIDHAPLATKVLHIIAEIRVPYSLYGPLRHELERHGSRILDEAFAREVRVKLAVPKARVASLSSALCDLSSGSVVLEDHVVATRYLLETA
ncbi:MAG: YigZ family protein [Anaerolineae bacterium]